MKEVDNLATIQFTLKIIKKRPLRALLTICQVALGVCIVALILSLNFQATSGLGAFNEILGSSLAKISAVPNLHVDELERLLLSENIESAFLYQEHWQPTIVVDGAAYSVSQIAETTEGYALGVNLEVVEGHFFTAEDQAQGTRVVLLSETIANRLFPNQSPLGKTIELGDLEGGRMEFEVIGVYKPLSPLLEFFISPSHLILPLQESQPAFWSLYIRSKPSKIYEAVADAQVLLADNFSTEFTGPAEYFIESSRFLAEQIHTVTLFLGVFAFIAIVISAIGLLCIMLVSVVERRGEIGLRQALGASKLIIIRQVLTEALVLSTMGGILGLGLAYFTANPFLNLLLQEMVYPRLGNLGGLHPRAGLVSLGLALGMGQIFALYPALQAANMPPMQLLRDN